jgi:splicing factor 3B subunit 3
MTTALNMCLYSLTLNPPTAISQAIVGQFSGTKEQQILTVSGSLLTLYRHDPIRGRIYSLLSNDLFSILRSIASLRLAGSAKGKLEHFGLSVVGHANIRRIKPTS